MPDKDLNMPLYGLELNPSTESCLIMPKICKSYNGDQRRRCTERIYFGVKINLRNSLVNHQERKIFAQTKKVTCSCYLDELSWNKGFTTFSFKKFRIL